MAEHKPMRTKILAAMSLLACAGLAGCDNSSTTPPANVQAAVPPCNCETQTPPAQTAATSSQARHHRVRHLSSYSYSEYDEHQSAYSSNQSADSSSQSQSYSYSEAESSEDAARRENAWVDGYGRKHYAAAASSENGPPVDDHVRLAAWHGYDAECDKNDKP